MPIAVIENPVDGDPFRKVATGQPLRVPAIAYNAMIDAALDFKNRRDNGRGQTINKFPEAGVVLVKNTSGSNVNRFGVLQITGPLISQSDNANEFYASVKLTGTTPGTPSTVGYGLFVVALEPIANGSCGRCVVSGVVVCQVLMNALADQFADMKNADSTKLASSALAGGADILWADVDGASPGDTVWAIVRLGRGRQIYPWTAGVISFGGFEAFAMPGPTDLGWTLTIPDQSAYLVQVNLTVKQNFSGSVTAAEPDAIDVSLSYTGGASTYYPGDYTRQARVGYLAVPTYDGGTADLETGDVTLDDPTWNYEDMGPRMISLAMLIASGQKGDTVSFSIGGSVVNGSGDSIMVSGGIVATKVTLDGTWASY